MINEFLEKWVADHDPDFRAVRFSLSLVRDGQISYDLFCQLKLYIDNMREFSKVFIAAK